MPHKPLEVAPAAARAFVKDMRAFHAAKTGLAKDEIAALQRGPSQLPLPLRQTG
jgi:hypothetical protein